MSFKVVKGKVIDGILVFQPTRYRDERGFFQTVYQESALVQLGLAQSFVQDNFSRSYSGGLRGLHLQAAPFAQGKLIFVLEGRAWSVAVDARKDSQSFGAWEAFELSAEVPQVVWLPSGLAHGFLALEKCLYGYKTTVEYHSEAERGIRWNDEELKISWPKEPAFISKKDQALPSWREFVRSFC